MAVTMSLEKSLCPGASSATKLWLAAPCWVARVVQVQSPTSLSHYRFGVRNKFNTCNIAYWTTFNTTSNTILQYTTTYYNFYRSFCSSMRSYSYISWTLGEIESPGPANSAVRLVNFHVLHFTTANPISNLQSPWLQQCPWGKTNLELVLENSVPRTKCSILNPHPMYEGVS